MLAVEGSADLSSTTHRAVRRAQETASIQQDRLWSLDEVAIYMGISVRAAQKLRDEGVLPDPLFIGKRVIRWVPDEVRAALAARPRIKKLEEPTHLISARQVRRARIEAMKATLTSSEAGSDAPVQKAILKAKAPAWMKE